jgi:thiol:disulfide interchange protein
MKLMRTVVLCLFLCLPAGSLLAKSNVEVELLLDAVTARPGDTIMAAIQMRMAPNWHTYWRNPGESGIATDIDWNLPPGLAAHDILWPVPEAHVAGGITTYVHYNETLLLVPITISPEQPHGLVDLSAIVDWLECEVQCIPGDAPVSAQLNIGEQFQPSPHAPIIEAWKNKLPLTGTHLELEARWAGEPEEDVRPFLITWNDAAQQVDFFSYENEDYEVSGQTQVTTTEPGKTFLRKNITLFEGEWPREITGLFLFRSSPDAPLEAYEVTLNLGAPESRAAQAAPAPGTDRGWIFWLGMFGGALLGGIILNIMPCVLPVIALKILGFVNQSKEEPKRVRQLGLIFTLGVLTSFLALAAMVILVQQAGHAADWGMQFSNPQFLVGMTVLVTLVALNLFGLFEINLGGKTMGAAGMLAAKEGNSGAFFNGVLVTALATPCTAPFLAVALGFAFAQPPIIIILMFLTIGAGLALPYLALSLKPGWLKFLPKPGAWMEKFKVAMGFPMLATAIWLFYLTTDHFGHPGTLWLGLFLVILAMAAWIWGEFVQRASSHRAWGMGLSLLLLATAYLYVLEKQLQWRAPVATAAAWNESFNTAEGIQWERWSPEAVAKARAEGRPVLVDFTAKWCLTCKMNKAASIEIPSVIEKLDEINAVALIADYTHRPPAISAELKRFNRAGVPLVLVYPADPGKDPIILPESLPPFIGPGIVLRALDQAAAQPIATTALVD